MNDLIILKIGGNVLDNPDLLQTVLERFAGWKESRMLVHGGGKVANVLMKKLGIEPVMVDGRRVTNEKTLEIVTMVYAGGINKYIVSQLQSRNCNALGLTGADANVIPAVRRPVMEVDYGFVGDVDPSQVQTQMLVTFLGQNLVPVFAPLTHDTRGSLLNTNADTIASSLAIAMAGTYRVKLVYCFEKNGVLSDPDDDTSVIGMITKETYNDYKSKGIIHSGMIPKLDNAFAALEAGVSTIRICGPQAFVGGWTEGGTLIQL